MFKFFTDAIDDDMVDRFTVAVVDLVRRPMVRDTRRNAQMVHFQMQAQQNVAELTRRFDRAPKPMYYQPAFLTDAWQEYLRDNKVSEAEVDPDAFVRWTYARALAHRQPRYKAMADNWGVTLRAEDVARVKSPQDVEDLIATALEARG